MCSFQRWQQETNFNSIKVRLKQAALHITSHQLTFQFHKGTIKTITPPSFGVSSTSFQFHKGTIKTSQVQQAVCHSQLFQFHKGTIKTFALTSDNDKLLIFQFHKGTIKTFGVLLLVQVLDCYFNSIKVRLKLDFSCIDGCSEKFQFHKGTIKTNFYIWQLQL